MNLQRKPIITGNWKMNQKISEAIELVNGLKRELYDEEGIEIVICPPYTALSELGESLQDSNIQLGAQDLFWESSGAYTGEVSASMLKDVGCRYVIIGHSERRHYLGETNEMVAKKVRRALDEKLIPIVCVGERLEEREEGKTFEVVKDHLANGLSLVKKEEIHEVVIAYEPVWAIGTGKNATAGQAEEVHAFIRKLLGDVFDKTAAARVRIQYGGSVKPENIAELMEEEDVNGALVGGASLTIEGFSQIVKRAHIRVS